MMWRSLRLSSLLRGSQECRKGRHYQHASTSSSFRMPSLYHQNSFLCYDGSRAGSGLTSSNTAIFQASLVINNRSTSHPKLGKFYRSWYRRHPDEAISQHQAMMPHKASRRCVCFANIMKGMFNQHCVGTGVYTIHAVSM